jgi:hypothetical protein
MCCGYWPSGTLGCLTPGRVGEVNALDTEAVLERVRTIRVAWDRDSSKDKSGQGKRDGRVIEMGRIGRGDQNRTMLRVGRISKRGGKVKINTSLCY